MLQYSLTTSSFSMDQFLNLFQFMARNVNEIIQEYFLRYYEQTLKTVITQQLKSDPAVDPQSPETLKIIYKQSEQFYRDIITSAFLVQQLDNFIGDILHTLRAMVDKLSHDTIRNLMSYDPNLISSPLERPSPEVDNQIFLGAKWYFLKKLYSYNFPILPGFILTTEMFRRQEVIFQYPEMTREIFQVIKERLAELETATGRNSVIRRVRYCCPSGREPLFPCRVP